MRIDRDIGASKVCQPNHPGQPRVGIENSQRRSKGLPAGHGMSALVHQQHGQIRFAELQAFAQRGEARAFGPERGRLLLRNGPVD